MTAILKVFPLCACLSLTLSGCATMAFQGMMSSGMYSDHKGTSGEVCEWYGDCEGDAYGDNTSSDAYGDNDDGDLYGDGY